jgi:hypothetical protein
MSKHHDALLAMWNRRDATALNAQAERIAELESFLRGLVNNTLHENTIYDKARAILEGKTS